jgi:hypothetical protein
VSGEGRELGGWYRRKWDLQCPRTWPMLRRSPESICRRGRPRRRIVAGARLPEGPIGGGLAEWPACTLVPERTSAPRRLGARAGPRPVARVVATHLSGLEGDTALRAAEFCVRPSTEMEVWRGSRPVGRLAPLGPSVSCRGYGHGRMHPIR